MCYAAAHSGGGFSFLPFSARPRVLHLAILSFPYGSLSPRVVLGYVGTLLFEVVRGNVALVAGREGNMVNSIILAHGVVERIDELCAAIGVMANLSVKNSLSGTALCKVYASVLSKLAPNQSLLRAKIVGQKVGNLKVMGVAGQRFLCLWRVYCAFVCQRKAYYPVGQGKERFEMVYFIIVSCYENGDGRASRLLARRATADVVAARWAHCVHLALCVPRPRRRLPPPLSELAIPQFHNFPSCVSFKTVLVFKKQ